MKRVRNPWSFSHFKRGPLMSLVGAGLMLGAIYVYMNKPDSEVFALTLLGLGAVAFGLKDPKLPKGGAAAMMVLVMFTLSSCVTFKKCTDKFGSNETHTITVRDTVEVKIPVYLEPLTLEGSTPIQDILQGQTVTDSSEKVLIQFWYDKYTNLLKYRTEVKADTILVVKSIPVEVAGDCPDTKILDKAKDVTGIARLWEQVKSFSVWLLLLFIVGIIMLTKWKKLKNFER